MANLDTDPVEARALAAIEQLAHLSPGHLSPADEIPFMAEGEYQSYAYATVSLGDLIEAISNAIHAVT